MRRILFLIVISFLFSFSHQAFGFKLPTKIDYVRAQNDVYFTADYDFTGILALSNCSGSLVRYDNSLDTDKAMVLTNGHCVSFMSPDTVIIVNRASSKRFSVLDSGGSSLGTVRAEMLHFATMTHTDLAIYRLEETYDEIYSRFATEALTFAREYAEIGTPIEVISGYWERGYSCSVEAIVYKLKEYNWTWKDSIRYSRPGCETIGGTSGSPVIEAGTRIVIGVNNTGNENNERCTLNNPCEVDEEGNISYVQGYSYGQQTSWIYGCLNDNREIDVNIEGCKLKP